MRGPHLVDLALASNAALLLIGLPLYMRLYATADPLGLARLVLVAHVVPTLAMFAAARALASRPRAHRALWTAILALSALSTIRLLDQHAIPSLLDAVDEHWALAPAVVVVGAVVIAAVVGLVVRIAWREPGAVRAYASLAPLWLVLTSAVLVPVGLRPTAGQLPASPPEGPVYVFVFDGLGRDVLLADRLIDASRFPNLRALADDGVFVHDAGSPGDATCEVIPLILAGRSVPRTRCTAAVASGDGLLDVLASRYRIAIYEPWLRDCDPGAPYDCRGAPYLVARYPERGLLAHWVPRFIQSHLVAPLGAGVAGGSMHPYSLPAFASLIEGLEDPAAPSTFAFVHVLLPHQPYVFDADGSGLGRDAAVFVHRPIGDPATASAAYERQTMFIDVLVGRFVSALRERGLYERSTIVITGDHGPPLPYREPFPPAQSPWVPLIIRSPLLRPVDPSAQYQHIDLAPTVLDLLGLPPLADAEGVSLLAERRPTRTRTFSFHGHAFVLDPAIGAWAPAR